MFRSVITSLLSRIPKIFSSIKNPESALLPTLNSALSALQATGGKIVCAVASLPTCGPGHLAIREDPKLAGTDAERKLFTTENPAWNETGYQTLMKVRCSNGLQVSAYHGNFVQHTLGADLEIAGVDADKAIGVLFSYDGKLDPKLDAHFQAALLYTSADGQRRVRCINVVAAVNEGGMETMKFVDQDAVVSVIAKEGMLDNLPEDVHYVY